MGVGGQRHDPDALLPGKTPGTHYIGGRVGARDGMEWCEDSHPHRDSISGQSIQ
jgi:hypothetical protein